MSYPRVDVLVGAIDAYLLAHLQLGIDNLIGRTSLKRTDFLVGDKLGEGSFGIVYSGVIVPKNVSPKERFPKSGKAKTTLINDDSFKQKVILKKVKFGVQRAEEFGDYEEWFNYRLSRASPKTCAEFLRSFVADQNNSQFIKGGKWLAKDHEAQLLSRFRFQNAAKLPIPLLNPKDLFLSKLASVAASSPKIILNRPVNPDTPPYLDLFDSPKLMVTPAQVERSVSYNEHRPKSPLPYLPLLFLHGKIVYIGMSLVPAVTELIVAELRYLQWMNLNQPIYLYINSTGTTRDDGETMSFE
ncbi:ATP-dependent Clp protease proteolytic subunit-related protein 3 [Hibiscus syriacus]|uniref:ATP-dependent Clp protease proteolytic subunit-related protein 3 n=1 Tax=Hibiscus syriacus TaxID=106335 RepID=A0A6A2YFN7_HIBSY|nr:ATP-dependent Clp protease proteolytic subunit-related protein 3 [Hibiscus syriacus]